MRRNVTIDGNEAAARVAYKTNEVVAIYPITPSSPMGELADAWAATGKKNIWSKVPRVIEMQSEGGAAGAVHGSLQAGSLTTTFTASQGLLLMIPNMYKIAGELTSAVFHIAARSIAGQALSIFGDHSDVMAARATGWGMLFSNSVQEVHDMALVAQAATLRARVPLLHIFDGFRTSHEVMKIEELTDEDIRSMIDDDLVRAHRVRSLSPDRPVIRGTAQNPDVFFQARETANPYYLAVPGIVQEAMDRFAGIVGRQYHLFDYVGHPEAERVMVMMGSGCGAAEEAVEAMAAQDERIGLIKVRLFRPFSVEHFVQALPSTVKVIAVLDRTKEPGSVGEPLYQDIVTAVSESMADGKTPFTAMPRIVGGRYGLGSKEFTPAMAKGVFDEITADRPKNHFAVGIIDDLTNNSVDYDPGFITESDQGVRAVFWGLGSDGTVGANKNSIKIIGEETPNYAQGYFVYDSKKAGAVTVSHLRFGPEPIRSTYQISKADFVAVHQFNFLERFDVLASAREGAVFLLNSPYGPEEVWDQIPRSVQETVLKKGMEFYVVDGYKVARDNGMGQRINTVMQTCFFAVSGVLPRDEAIAKIKEAIRKTYGRKGESVVQANFKAVDAALAHMHKVEVPAKVTSTVDMRPPVPEAAPEFVQSVTAKMIAGYGDQLPVSSLPNDGTYPVGTTKWEKRGIAQEVPVWDADLCIQCGKCVMVCPHSAIRSKVIDVSLLEDAPAEFETVPARWRELSDQQYRLQVSVDDCTGCQLCVETCPAVDKKNKEHKAIDMAPVLPVKEIERENWDFFMELPDVSRTDGLNFRTVKNIQLLQPLFEFSGACAGCGETPYLKLLSQLFGDRSLVANATGCSSIYGGNLPTTPWTANKDGRGPAWANSLFEDNAEFGLGMRLAVDEQTNYARQLVKQFEDVLGAQMTKELLESDQSTEVGIAEQRGRVQALRDKLTEREGHWDTAADSAMAKDLAQVADSLVKKSVWIVGGDGWAYDIGYGGLDHVLGSGQNVNVLVLDTEVYSNTGGQASKSTPRAAVAKFAAQGKRSAKKDLGLMAVQYGNVYVAKIAMGASDAQTVKAFREAEQYDGPSLIIAYSQCIAHGIDMSQGMNQQKLAVQTGHWPLYRFDPTKEEQPFQLDSKAPKLPISDYMYNEVRYRVLQRNDPEIAKVLLEQAQADVAARWQRLMALSAAGDKKSAMELSA